MDPDLLVEQIKASVERYAESGLAEPWYAEATLKASRPRQTEG
jgi:hypothetical protein